MSLASWIYERFSRTRPKRTDLRRQEDVVLYLRRLEDRRVMTTTPFAMDDAYFVQDPMTPLFVGGQQGVLSNDFNPEPGPLFTLGGTFATELGGTVTLGTNGAFTYFAPTDRGALFVDVFGYTAQNAVGESNPASVILYVGEVPIEYEQPTLLPIFGVEFETPGDFVQVSLAALPGSSLTILDPSGISFDIGFNGANEFSISASAATINKALNSLEYTPPSLFSGPDAIGFLATVDTGGSMPEITSHLVPLFVLPSNDVTANPDQYYVPPFQSTFFVSPEAGLLANDTSDGEFFLFIDPEVVTTDLGGTVQINSDGSFAYTPPAEAGPNFVDSFVYFASNEINTSDPGQVTLYVGEVPVPEDKDVPLALFNVEFGSPEDMVTVDLSTTQGGTLTLLDTSGITFVSGNNGGNSFTISGFFEDVNFALDSLQYRSALNFSGLDFVNFNVIFPERRGPATFQEPLESSEPVPIKVLPVADAPILSLAPRPVIYQPGLPVPVFADVALTDLDGSEIRGLVILDFVPPGVFPSVGQQLANDPKVYLVNPNDLPNLTFLIDASAPPNFNIAVVATSIETTNQPGVFGGPGGPLIPNDPMDPRFATTPMLLTFVREGSEGLPPVGPPPPGGPPPFPPPPPMEVVFLLGPLTIAPPGEPILQNGPDPGPQQTQNVVAIVIENDHNHGLEHHSITITAFSQDSLALGNDAATAEEQNDEQGQRSSETTGIYLRKLGGDAGQFARLPEELSEDYSRFMDFLKTLPNGDYVVYFKRDGQTHEDAAVRQVVVKVRVVNHRLNPDPGEFKPAGEVAEPPVDPNAPVLPSTVNAATPLERAEIPAGEVEVSRTLAAGLAAIAGWKLRAKKEHHSAGVDRVMEGFLPKPSQRFRLRKQSQQS